MTNKRCPKDSPKSVLLFVEQYLLRMTRLHTTRRDENALLSLKSRTKFNRERSTDPRAMKTYNQLTYKQRD